MSAAAAHAHSYEEFRRWLNRQGTERQQQYTSPSGRLRALEEYAAALSAEGLADTEVDRRIAPLLEDEGELETQRWNHILTAPEPRFNTDPNAFLARMIRDRAPGKALDAGMGQGRNAIFLAQNGWDVHGFDNAAEAVAAAQKRAVAAALPLTVQVAEWDSFVWGDNHWDLIAALYVPVRQFASAIVRSLKPGGILVVEALHRDPAQAQQFGFGVLFDTNELLHLFDGLRILQYEDAAGIPDFGPRQNTSGVVRLCAARP